MLFIEHLLIVIHMGKGYPTTFKFFTIWSAWFTFITFGLGLYISFTYDIGFIGNNQINDNNYGIMQAWKWFIILY
jgi:hypothetical protein